MFDNMIFKLRKAIGMGGEKNEITSIKKVKTALIPIKKIVKRNDVADQTNEVVVSSEIEIEVEVPPKVEEVAVEISIPVVIEEESHQKNEEIIIVASNNTEILSDFAIDPAPKIEIKPVVNETTKISDILVKKNLELNNDSVYSYGADEKNILSELAYRRDGKIKQDF